MNLPPSPGPTQAERPKITHELHGNIYALRGVGIRLACVSILKEDSEHVELKDEGKRKYLRD